MWDLLIMNSSIRNGSGSRNYLNLIAAEKARGESARARHTGKTGRLFARMARKIHF